LDLRKGIFDLFREISRLEEGGEVEVHVCFVCVLCCL
jgi:hypothetical protein